MAIPLVDLKAQYEAIHDEINAAIMRVLSGGRFILGSEVESFEKELALYLGTKFAVGVASGTDALVIALLSLGIGPGDEVITTPFTFVATAEAIVRCGARPVFADIEPETCNIDPEKIEQLVTPRTRAILPVHLYGQPADMEPILELGNKYGLMVVEDCAQAIGAEYKGRKTGSLSNVACLSFFPTKTLGACGDGGAIVTSESKVAEMADLLRRHGARNSYYYVSHGFNSRLDAIQAAILRVKLRYLDSWIELRRGKAGLYEQLLGGIDGILTPCVGEYSRHSYNYYTIRLKDSGHRRSGLRKYLESSGIQTMVYYPLSLHLQEVYRSLGYKAGDFPVSEQAQEEVLSLPMFPELKEEQIREVAEVIRQYQAG